MLNRKLWILGLVFILVACDTLPTATEAIQVESTLPSPAVATLAPTVDLQPTASAAVQPTLAPTEPATETPTLIPTELPQPLIYRGTFVNMEVPSSGSFALDPATNTLTLNADFTTQSGPDLFVILSGASDVALDFQSFSQTVTSAPIQFLGPLSATSGLQTYTLPAGTDLAQYRSIVIWCQTYNVAFAAALIQ